MHSKTQILLFCVQYLPQEKMKLGFSYETFAKGNYKNSKVNLFMVKDKIDLAKFFKAKHAWKKDCSWDGSRFNF